MEPSLNNVEKLDNRTKLLVSGFNRNCRKLLPKRLPYYDIPTIVNHICMLFYWIQECLKLHGTAIDILAEGMQAKVKPDESGWNIVYGDLIFDNKSFQNTIIEYELELNIRPGYGAFGIINCNRCRKGKF